MASSISTGSTLMPLNPFVFQKSHIFGSADLAQQWLNTANIAFGGRTPVSLLETQEGKISVLAALNAIEQGVPYKSGSVLER